MKLSKEHSSVLNDTKAIEIVEHIGYDFSMLDKRLPFESNLVFVAWAKQFDDKIRAYLKIYLMIQVRKAKIALMHTPQIIADKKSALFVTGAYVRGALQ